MAKTIEVTVWATGVVQDKEGRDVCLVLTEAANQEGKFTQAFDNYVDLPDRINVQVRKYARISDAEIENKFEYENHRPNIIGVTEATIMKGINVCKGLQEGGFLVINTTKDPEALLKYVPEKERKKLKAVATIDAIGIAPEQLIDYSGAEGAEDVSAIGAGLGSVMAGAIAAVSGIVKKESILAAAANRTAAKRGYDEVKIKVLK
ncbi:MAG: 2-oxoacid:acceptor oxidoreductase family protein [Bacteroidales bacterium]|jgi:Pyruvate/2-oxoacid:ferredoxin oxidoreductase gamma subunit|nr:2-oxoacid:acceptor oxidoreductase family protein [Bacteroidales bacterium]MBR5347567.1 2-oxoacid:acceptor oxidoreductase family protein [Deltaproteobacteria bacterium]